MPRFARADEDATPAPEFAGAAGRRGIATSIACVTINRIQQWWRGTEAADLDELLREFAAASYPVNRVAHAKCSNCDAAVFDVVLDDEEGCARRTCGTCGSSLLMLDSQDTVDSADLGQAACPCGGERFEIAVGFALRDDDEIRWVYIALRCTADGTLGVYADWKIDYSPTAQLFEQV